MEDSIHGVFKKEDKQVIYKQIISDIEADELNNILLKLDNNIWLDGAMHISTGSRPYLELDLFSSHENLKEIYNRLPIILRDYFPDLQVNNDSRFYNHQYGSTKPHKDGMGGRDGISNYTLLLYLTDNFNDGKLSIKLRRSIEEENEDQPDKHHKVFTIIPKKGYGVIFHKELLHWASEIVEGEKNFLLIHLFSNF